MRDYLKDLVEHTHDLGCIDLIKITGDDKSTAIVGVAEDLSVVLEGEFKNPHPDQTSAAAPQGRGVSLVKTSIYPY